MAHPAVITRIHHKGSHWITIPGKTSSSKNAAIIKIPQNIVVSRAIVFFDVLARKSII
jgi:hypothetical protein